MMAEKSYACLWIGSDDVRSVDMAPVVGDYLHHRDDEAGSLGHEWLYRFGERELGLVLTCRHH